jgi:hypothetical protein
VPSKNINISQNDIIEKHPSDIEMQNPENEEQKHEKSKELSYSPIKAGK